MPRYYRNGAENLSSSDMEKIATDLLAVSESSGLGFTRLPGTGKEIVLSKPEPPIRDIYGGSSQFVVIGFPQQITIYDNSVAFTFVTNETFAVPTLKKYGLTRQKKGLFRALKQTIL